MQQQQHTLTLQYQHVTLVVRILTCQSISSSSLNHELAKIQHHVQMDRLIYLQEQNKKKKNIRAIVQKKKKNSNKARGRKFIKKDKQL